MVLKIKNQTLIFFSLYMFIFFICFLWDYFDKGYSIKIISDKCIFLTDILFGISISSFLLFIGLIAIKIFPRFEELLYLIKGMMGEISFVEIFILSFSSGVVEEVLFRSLLLNKMGIFSSSILFGFFHGFFLKKWWLWSMEATGVGFIFSLMVIIREGSILSVIVAHFLYNFISFYNFKNLKNIF